MMQQTPTHHANRPQQAMQAYQASSRKETTIDWPKVEEYIPLLKSVVYRMRIYFPVSVDVEDLYSIGLNGLISAVKQFDNSKGRTFGSYAKMRIRGSLLDELRRLDWLSRENRGSVKEYRKVFQGLEQELGRQPNQLEVCKVLNISEIEYGKLQKLNTPLIHVPLDSPVGHSGEDAPSLSDILSDPTEQNARDIAESHELIDLLGESLKELEDTPQKVLGLYYLDGLRLAEIAVVLNVSESRICQIHTGAIKDLRLLLKEKLTQ